MAKSRSILGPLAAVAGLAAVFAGGWFYYNYAHRDVIPELSVPDINPDTSRQAARIDRSRGQAYMRAGLPADEAMPVAPFPSVGAGQVPAGWETVGVGTALRLGTLLHVAAQSAVEFTTAGAWYMGFDGDGAMVFQDARRNPEGTEHTVSVYVQSGNLRAKAANDNYKGYFLEITTATAKIRVSEGEFGMQINDAGRGRMWLMSGKAVALWNDGRRKELGLRGLENL